MWIPTYESDKEMLGAMGKILQAMTTLYDNRWTLDLYCKIRKDEPEEYRTKRRTLLRKIANEIDDRCTRTCKEIVKKTNIREDAGEIGFLRDTQTLLHVRLDVRPPPPVPTSQYIEPTLEEIINDIISEANITS